jgi:tetratricopeptide (TPR) repeat protein
MERAKYYLICCLLFWSFVGIKASYKSDIYTAYIGNNMSSWKKIIDQMETIEIKSNDLLLELVNYQYGYIAWCIGNKRKDEAKKYLDLAEMNISVLAKNNHNLSMVNSYKAAFYGYRMGLNILLAPFIGLKSMECAKMAIKQEAGNPFGHIQYANIQYYMPSVFGGSKTEALKFYMKAKDLMEKNEKDMVENWNYLNLLTLIAQAYCDLNDFQASRMYFEIILKREPGFGWVKNELYPQLLKKMGN